MTLNVIPKTAALALAMAVSALGAGCGSEPGTGPDGTLIRSDKVRLTEPRPPAEDTLQLATDNRRFAVDLHHALRTGTDNLVLAPVSVTFALAMLEGGARGDTAAEIAGALRFTLPSERLHPAMNALDAALAAPPSESGGAILHVANAAWGQKDETFVPAYLDLLAENYGAGMHVVDFAGDTETSRQTINAWVSERTAGKISELFAPDILDPLTRLVLTNAVYFRADWKTPFAADSRQAPFHAPGGDVSVAMMAGPKDVPIWSGPGYQAAALPYRGGHTSMIVVVPDAGGFDAFEQALTGDALGTIFGAKDGNDNGAGAQPGAVLMPRFKIETGSSLVDALKALGMRSAFSDADLSGINGRQDLYVADVVHKVFLAVDEKGTEAAAATGVVVNTRSAALVSLVVDRPFLFFIRHDPTGAILFQGRILSP
jgi:serpin B